MQLLQQLSAKNLLLPACLVLNDVTLSALVGMIYRL